MGRPPPLDGLYLFRPGLMLVVFQDLDRDFRNQSQGCLEAIEGPKHAVQGLQGHLSAVRFEHLHSHLVVVRWYVHRYVDHCLGFPRLDWVRYRYSSLGHHCVSVLGNDL